MTALIGLAAGFFAAGLTAGFALALNLLARLAILARHQDGSHDEGGRE